VPKIGLLSDSHGRSEATNEAVRILLDAGAEILIHLGDIGAVEVIDALAVPQRNIEANGHPGDPPAGQVETRIVFGNVDSNIDGLSTYARHLGIQVDHPIGRLDIGGGYLVFMHGDRPTAMHQAVAQGVRYLCHGHTHLPRDEIRGSTRIINPGALSRSHRRTVAILDTDADELTFYQVDPR